MALSRLTLAPRNSRAREVRRMVSGITSAVKIRPEMDVTVRQTPFTAMLSPTTVPSVTVSAVIFKAVPALPALMAPTVPISSMIPVNISYLFSG